MNSGLKKKKKCYYNNILVSRIATLYLYVPYEILNNHSRFRMSVVVNILYLFI